MSIVGLVCGGGTLGVGRDQYKRSQQPHLFFASEVWVRISGLGFGFRLILRVGEMVRFGFRVSVWVPRFGLGSGLGVG